MDCDNSYSIAIDGPAGSGKSTIARKVAEILNMEYIDTGAMYRALTLKIMNNNIDPLDTKLVLEEIQNSTISFKKNSIYLDGKLVDKEIRKNYISQNVSHIARLKEVREIVLDLLRNMAKSKNVIMDGRDIGSVILPNSEYKFFITATVEERSKRRYEELKNRNEKNISLENIISDMKKRDYMDSNRKFAPLVQTEDSYLIDTTNKSIDETVNEIVSIVMGV